MPRCHPSGKLISLSLATTWVAAWANDRSTRLSSKASPLARQAVCRFAAECLVLAIPAVALPPLLQLHNMGHTRPHSSPQGHQEDAWRGAAFMWQEASLVYAVPSHLRHHVGYRLHHHGHEHSFSNCPYDCGLAQDPQVPAVHHLPAARPRLLPFSELRARDSFPQLRDASAMQPARWPCVQQARNPPWFQCRQLSES